MTVDDISIDHWTTQESVARKYNTKVGGEAMDFTDQISEATDSVQSWYQAATGTPTAELPKTEGELDDLLEQATAWEAASEAYFAFSQNIQNGDDLNRDESLHRKARRKFSDWQESDEAEPDSKTDTKSSGSVRGRSGSLTSDIFGGR